MIDIIAPDAKEGNTTTAIDLAAATQRLFEIFIQTEDMAKYTKDFNEFAAVLGNPNTEDPFDWSQFDLQTDKDLKKLSEEMQALEEPQREEQREMSMMMKLRGDDVDYDDEEGEYIEEGEYDDDVDYEEDDDEEDDEDEDEYVTDSGKRLEVNNNEEKDFDRDHEVEDIEGEEKLDAFAQQNRFFDDEINFQSEEFSMNADENLNLKFNQKFELQDEDGHIWSACLLDTDVVQKVTPGQRVNSYRALTVIGNGKGAAGFAMGKGKSGPEAIYSACRYVRP